MHKIVRFKEKKKLENVTHSDDKKVSTYYFLGQYLCRYFQIKV